MSRIIKVCEQCKPRLPELSKYFGDGDCEACPAKAVQLSGFWLRDVLAALRAFGAVRGAAKFVVDACRFEEEKPPAPRVSGKDIKVSIGGVELKPMTDVSSGRDDEPEGA